MEMRPPFIVGLRCANPTYGAYGYFELDPHLRGDDSIIFSSCQATKQATRAQLASEALHYFEQHYLYLRLAH
jgi:hypothetical protein